MRSSKHLDGASFYLLLMLEKQDLTKRPWIQFIQTLMEPLETFKIESDF